MSERTTLKRVAGMEWPRAGEWRPLGGKAVVGCGDCGETATLTDHEIDSDGKVTPSLVCPFDCGWHVWARLDGWEAPDA